MPFHVSSFDDLFLANRISNQRVVIVRPEDERIIEALAMGFADGFVSSATLIGETERLNQLLSAQKLGNASIELVETADDGDAVSRGLAIQADTPGTIFFAGQLKSQDFLELYADAAGDKKRISRLSQVVVFEVPGFDRLIIVTDPTVHVAPRLPEKVTILNNVIAFCHRCGLAKPRIALIAAVEKIDYIHMPHTIDSAALVKMVQTGQIKGAVVDGPLALDNAVSEHAAAVKGIRSPVAGAADVYMMPDAEAGVLLCKILVYFAQARSASVIVGGPSPVVFPSRSDDAVTKYNSMKLAGILAAEEGVR